MNHFNEALANFREAIREEGERSISPSLQQLLYREKSGGSRRLRWAVAAGLILTIGAIPLYQGEQRKRAAAQDQADTLLLEQVNESLSQSVLPALEPLMGVQ